MTTGDRPQAGANEQSDWSPEDWQAAKAKLVLNAVAPSTTRSYAIGWKQWLLFSHVRGRSPFLTGVTREQKYEDVEELRTYVVHLGQVMGRAADTVRQRLYGIRQQHLAAGHVDPLFGKTRVALALKGLQNCRGGSHERCR